MLIRIILSCLSFCLGLSSCAKPTVINNNDYQLNSQPKIVLTEAEDPDRNGENKGYNYFPLTRTPTGNKVFIFDPNYGAWAVYDEHGQRINVGRASGGKLYCPDVKRSCKTITGTFRVMAKKGADCKSNIYPLHTRGGAPMPYCMRFESNGYAIHGSNDVPDYNASHGCIRVDTTAARWLNQDFLQVGSTVLVLPYDNHHTVAEPSSAATNAQQLKS